MPIKFLLVSAVDNQTPIETHHPALGFGYIASSLRREFGGKFTFKVINTNFTQNIRAFEPNIIGITTVTKNYNVAKGYAAIAKQSNIPVIIGGVHASFMPQTLTQNMDLGVIGEGDRTIIDLMDIYLASGKFDKADLCNINGIVFRDDGRLIETKSRELIKPLDDIPYPARDLLKIHKSAHMLSSRGCPYHCAFCSATRQTGNQTRYATAEYVADEIEDIYSNYGIEYLTIYDEMFALDCKRVIKIQELLVAKNLIGKFRFAVNIRSDYITDELAEVLNQMNVDVVALGTESGSQKTLDYLKSGSLKVEDNVNAIRILKKHHIRPYCSFVIGSPDETLSDVMETMKFIKDNGVYWFDVSILVPFPGTAVWDYALSAGKVSGDMDFTRLDFYIKPSSVNLSKHLNLEDLVEVRAKMMVRKARYLYRYNLMRACIHPITTFKAIIERLRR